MDNNKKSACVTHQEREAILAEFAAQDCVVCGRQIESARQVKFPGADICQRCAGHDGVEALHAPLPEVAR